MTRREHASREGAQQNREERAHFEHRVAADELHGPQDLRQQAVLCGREERGVHAEHEEHAQQYGEVARHQPDGPERHDEDLDGLHHLDDARLVEPIGKLTRDAGEQEERKDEQPAGEIGQHLRVELRVDRAAEGDEDDEYVAVDVVVERSQCLGTEERKESSLTQEPELVRCTHVGCRIAS